MFKHLLVVLLFILSVVGLSAQSIIWWTDIAQRDLPAGDQRIIHARTYRSVSIDLNLLRDALHADAASVIELPLPDGGIGRFEVWETPVMHPDLQARYPEIRCYTGRGLDDPAAKIKLDYTPQGFHAMIHSPGHSPVFIDPYLHGRADYAMVYFKKDYVREKGGALTCGFDPNLHQYDDEEGLIQGHAPSNAVPDVQGDCKLRRYRLALSCTGEYAAFHGGTKPLVLAAMNTTMNRINGVYENEFAVTMQIIANNDTLIFLNASTDPFTNDDGGTMLDENQTTVTARIGAANYDIGHVFSTGGGGIAGLRVVCSNGNKARGVTGGGSPIGDPFDIDYVAHEMGHQFGGNHTQNNPCNSVASASMEPGSASTIMGYAGICSPDVQNNSDAYFHAISIQEIASFITTGNGNTCPVKITTGNNAPTVNAGPDRTIPKSTPFALTATANDIDGDPLTYCWEQMDPQAATMPPVSTNTGGPMFRSYTPVSSPVRFFPRLPDLVNNVNSTWEELPGVARTMNFRVTVRDNFADAGCTEEDDVVLTVSATAGPFVVSSPNTNVLWNVGTDATITWDVANTNAAPVNCSLVKITLSTDGGLTYPVVLLEQTENDGSATIVVPNNISNTCRVRVEAVNNYFFDISNVNFRIETPPVPTFLLSADQSQIELCSGESASFNLITSGLVGFADPVTITVGGLPAGASFTVSPNPAAATGMATVTLSDFTPDMAGNYTLVCTATSGAIVREVSLSLFVFPGAPSVMASAGYPANGASNAATTTILSWSPVQYATHYAVELANSPSFDAGAILFSQTVNVNSATVTGLTVGQVYYWRVRSGNDCGDGAWPAAAVFQVGAPTDCNHTFSSTNVPLNIDVNGVVTASSLLNIPDSQVAADVNISLAINHTWVGDLGAVLISPSGTSVELFHRPGEPVDEDGCGNNNIAVTLDDEAAQTAVQLEGMCNSAPPAISGTFQSMAPLSDFDGKNIQGEWRLVVTDYYAEIDEGALTAWSLSFCYPASAPAGSLANNAPLTVTAGATAAITNAYLLAQAGGSAAQQIYTLLTLPANGQLLLNGTPLALGGVFSQAQINAGQVTYQHNGGGATADQFTFSLLDQSNAAWLQQAVFQIVILQNTLSASSAVSQNILCHNGANGSVTVTATGGTPPLQYSLNGGPTQASPVFSGLSAGTYAVVVTDANGFTRSTPSVMLGNPNAITVSTSVAFDDLTVIASGGTGALNFSLNGGAAQSGNVFENLNDGVYTVVIIDANGCTASTQVLVSVSALLANANITQSLLCFGDDNGAISVMVAGGFTPYEYSLDGVNFQPSNVFSGLSAGSYTVTVRDANGTTTTTSALMLQQPDQLNVSASSALNIVTASATGGTAPVSYSINGGAAQSSGTFTVGSQGAYLILVTDANGCTASTMVNVTVPPVNIAILNPVFTINCDGSVGEVEVGATGGVPPYQYQLDGGAPQNSGIFNNILPGAHTFTAIDAFGQTATVDLAIAEPPVVTASVAVNGNDATVTVMGGLLPLEYELNTGVASPNGYFENLPNGAYTVTVTQANGCTETATFTISYNQPELTATWSNVTCFGLQDGSITVSGQSGLPPYEFAFNGGPWGAQNSWSGLAAQSYNIQMRDAAGTVVSINVNVTQPAALTAQAFVAGNGTITVSVNGGTPTFAYSLDGVNFQNGNVFEMVANGEYTITVRDANGCTTTVSATVVGIEAVVAEWGLAVTPNPSAGQFRLTLRHAPAGDMLMEVFGAEGRLLQSRVLTVQGEMYQAMIDLNEAPAGMYMLRLRNGAQTTAVRLSVVK